MASFQEYHDLVSIRQTPVTILRQARTLHRCIMVDRSSSLCYPDGGGGESNLQLFASLAVIGIARWIKLSAQEGKQVVQGGKGLPFTVERALKGRSPHRFLIIVVLPQP